MFNRSLARIILLLLAAILFNQLGAADNPDTRKKALAKITTADPIKPDNWKIHKIGTLWHRVTNFSYQGDDAYTDRAPSCDWPGGSGNSYLYRGTIWLTAKVNKVVHSTQGDDHEFAPLDSVHILTGPGAKSEEDTWTRYYDVKAPLAADHFPLGVEVTERTYAWSASYADDFIIYEYTIKNVGVDGNGDGLPDTPRDLEEFYFTFRFDADVSKLPNWGAEYSFVNWDDHVLSNAGNWDWIQQFPQMAGINVGLTQDKCDSTMIFMWDGDNPDYPADNGQEDDLGNPGPDGTLQSPGFVGIKVLKTVPFLKPSSFHQCNYYNDPKTDKESYDRMISKKSYDPLVPDANGKPYAYDYRGILSFGPVNLFKTGDSIKVTAALGVGCDPKRGGIYSLKELVKNMDVAKLIVDANYAFSPEKLAPSAPTLSIKEYVENGQVKGMRVIWDAAATKHENFRGFKVWKSSGKTASGAYDWKPLGKGVYRDTTGSASWPPPAGSEPGTYEVIDRDVINGFDYYYAVQAFSKVLPEPFGVMETNFNTNLKYVSPANPVANTLDRIKVVPNPYIGSSVWNNPLPSDADPWQHRLQFTNLPADASIKIFTLDGDLVDEIRSGEIVRKGSGSIGATNSSVAEWDLITRSNQEAAPGLYMFVVDSPTCGQKVGKFVIIR